MDGETEKDGDDAYLAEMQRKFGPSVHNIADKVLSFGAERWLTKPPAQLAPE